MIAVPIAVVIAVSVMTGFHPARTVVRRPGPISCVPRIAVADRIPVAADPRVALAGASGLHSYNANRRRRADSDSDVKLREGSRRCQQCPDNQFSFHDSIPFLDDLQGESTLLALTLRQSRTTWPSECLVEGEPTGRSNDVSDDCEDFEMACDS